MDCHEAEFVPRKKGMAPEWVGVRPELFAKSVHGKLNCVDCHADIKESPHDSKVAPAQCASCHEKESDQYAASIHGMSHKLGASDAASCASCHGTHGVSSGEVPSLAGQTKESLVSKMHAFKNGSASGTIMPQLAKGYTDAQIEALAGWFSTQKAAR
jgi:cytochrome c553